MNVQYISDSLGKTTGVFIPINEWILLKEKYSGIEEETTSNTPPWHQELVLQRLKDSEVNEPLEDFDTAMDEIEKDL